MLQNSTRLALVRILGNDLPPRHSAFQTERNVEFILKHEPQFANCEKIWLLNRIVDEEKRLSLAQTLESHGHRVVSIEFDPQQYHKASAGKSVKEKVSEIVRINDARNRAIDVGKNLKVRWILPMDGNCIFSEYGWNNLVADLARLGRKLFLCRWQRPILHNLRAGRAVRINPQVYFVPMYRLRSNDDFFASEASLPSLDEQEPQVVLRSDCSLRFDPNVGYGFDDKVEFLRRVRSPIRYMGQGYVPSDRETCAGYVFRLASGQEAADSDINARAASREEAMENLVGRLDSMIAST